MRSPSTGPRPRTLERTGTPGIFKRGKCYVVVYREPSGKQCKRSAKTLAEARDLKAALTTDIRRGEYRTTSKKTFSEHAPEWIEAYAGRTSRGFRETTRADYRRALGKEAIPVFGRMRLTEIEPRHIKTWLNELASRGYAASTIRGIFAPVRAMLADAAEEGLIRQNPAAGVRIPPTAKTAEPKQRALTPEEVARLRAALRNEQELLLIDVLLVTGLRISEAIALNVEDVDFGNCRVRVHRRYYKGFDAPKSAYGRREVPITKELAQRIWALRKRHDRAADSDPLFVSVRGERLETANAYNRILKPAMKKAGIAWGGFHRLRHTTATHLIRSGASANEAQLWLGHHDPGFTARTYVHLETSDLPDPRVFDSLIGTLEESEDADAGAHEPEKPVRASSTA